ncbi:MULTISPECIES: phage head closure protein [unclassified Caballeronia]|uniref:phage head closure protein n=1 Tax=unclassified Caballeronia TaxID=2646786 RepID=UPI002854DE4A|nr:MULTISPECIES: phage head closure protein [unclassified Caballeronia]MDR5772464.1 phage head closure protein [Caballeronia sp. LZ002]MDR5847898.1 phage head closure protein [Caballeronia sp. LZ003]
MLRAGSLNRTVRIERRAKAKPQDFEIRWEEVATVPANIRMLNGKEVMAANANISMGTASIRIRYRTDIRAGMRVVHGDAAFHVTAVLPDYARREHVDLTCQTDDIH